MAAAQLGRLAIRHTEARGRGVFVADGDPLEPYWPVPQFYAGVLTAVPVREAPIPETVALDRHYGRILRRVRRRGSDGAFFHPAAPEAASIGRLVHERVATGSYDFSLSAYCWAAPVPSPTRDGDGGGGGSAADSSAGSGDGSSCGSSSGSDASEEVEESGSDDDTDDSSGGDDDDYDGGGGGAASAAAAAATHRPAAAARRPPPQSHSKPAPRAAAAAAAAAAANSSSRAAAMTTKWTLGITSYSVRGVTNLFNDSYDAARGRRAPAGHNLLCCEALLGGVLPLMFFCTRREGVPAGAELLFDYGEAYWRVLHTAMQAQHTEKRTWRP